MYNTLSNVVEQDTALQSRYHVCELQAQCEWTELVMGIPSRTEVYEQALLY